MDDETADILKSYQQQQAEERRNELEKNSSLIHSFIDFCEKKQILLTKDDFDYIQTIGIVASYPNIVHLLNDKVSIDKEELVEMGVLEKEFKTERFTSGYFYSDNYMVMAHPYFRRGHNQNNNFAPKFIDIFWKYNSENIQKYIAIDSDKVRINIDNWLYFERDTWYGAKYKKAISEIEDGIVKLRPPLGLSPFDIKFFFGNTYSLDIKWSSKNGIKSFQAEEFKEDSSEIIKNGTKYFPVKYLHAEFDTNSETFRHFDGAIHFYTKDEYYQRREGDFNYNKKNSSQQKAISQKLFKVNGNVLIDDWTELTSHYLSGNPLIFEYFEGKLPEYILDTLEKIKTHRQKTIS